MKAVCPNNTDHKEFATTAHVSEEWRVDSSGDFLEVLSSGQIVADPSPDNLWTCLTCGATAAVSR